MAVNRRTWEGLSEAYRKRLARAGVTPEAYTSGASLRAARGHATTPEHPSQAFRKPDQFGEYLRRRVARGEDVPEGMISKPIERRILGDSIGFPGRDTRYAKVFTRSRGGSAAGDTGTITTIRANPQTGLWDDVGTVEYNQSDFLQLTREARERGYVVQVVSVPSLGVTA